MNVTPLVDVVLVLLIIFMVVAPRMDQDVPVELPGIFNPDPEVDASSEPIKLTVSSAGEFYVGQEKYDLDGAIEALSAAHADEPLRRLVLRGDSRLTYGQVRTVLARAQQVGFPGMSFLVGERSRGKEARGAHDPTPAEPAPVDAAAAQAPAPADGTTARSAPGAAVAAGG
jgi:biopolymer transport protein ExbD/biopolymer transport protein TolR